MNLGGLGCWETAHKYLRERKCCHFDSEFLKKKVATK